MCVGDDVWPGSQAFKCHDGLAQQKLGLVLFKGTGLEQVEAFERVQIQGQVRAGGS